MTGTGVSEPLLLLESNSFAKKSFVDTAQIAMTLIVYVVQKSITFSKKRKEKEAKSMKNIRNEVKILVEIHGFIGLLLVVVYFMPVHGEFVQLNN
jgi:uncharacterized membrane protein